MPRCASSTGLKAGDKVNITVHEGGAIVHHADGADDRGARSDRPCEALDPSATHEVFRRLA